MYFNHDEVTAAIKTNVELSFRLATTTFACVERLAALNFGTARGALKEATTHINTLLDTTDMQECVNLQAALAQPAVEKAVAYSRSIHEIVSETKEEVSKLFEIQFAEAKRTVNGAIDRVSKNAPAGSTVAIAIVKSAITAANTAYDTMAQTAKQAAEIAKTNMSAVRNESAKTVAASKVKKAT